MAATRHRLIGEPFGVRPPRSLPEALVVAGSGTALSGPLMADAVLIAVAPVADRGHPGRATPWRSSPRCASWAC